jgi:hypothetical protein
MLPPRPDCRSSRAGPLPYAAAQTQPRTRPQTQAQQAQSHPASRAIIQILAGQFTQNGGAELDELETFQRTTNTLRRAIESLGLNRGRIARDVTPPDLQTYLAQRVARQADEEALQ